jgi:peptide/nickel transport system substrate-binding protein
MSELAKLEKMLSHGKISRREFLARVSALGLAATISPALLSTPVSASTPKQGGRLRIGIAGCATSDRLDPGLVSGVMAPMVSVGQTRNCLVEIDAQGKPVPELAESWEASPDAVTWRFKLRKGVEFHNGKSLEADDVIYSMNHHRGPDTKSVASGNMKTIKNIKADGKHTVVFTLEGGNADFAVFMADYHVQIFPDKTTDFDKGIGTGGYILEEWEPGVRALTRRNPNYWKEGRAHFDEVETLCISDLSARTNAISTGGIDVMNRCDPKTVHLLAKRQGIQIVKSTGYKHYTIPMRTDMAPYGDNNVRMALKHAIDRKALIETILRGYGELGNDHPISQQNRYHASDLPQREYDPDKARYYLKKAKMDNLSVTLSAANTAFEGAVDAAVLYKGQAAKAGIDIAVDRVPDDGYWSDVWMKVPLCMCYWSGRPTEDWMLSETYSCGANWNDTYWCHERFTKILTEARAELDEAKRREMYGELQSIIRDEGGVIVPMFATDLHAASTKLSYSNVASDREMDGYRLAERWWFA